MNQRFMEKQCSFF